jgi:hypothetical protein
VDVLEYEKLVADFENRLVTQLRSHGADAEYLEMWVPDSDLVKSLLNMVEAASAYGRDQIAVRVSSKTIASGQIDMLMNEIGNLAAVSTDPQPDGMLIVVKDIKAA